MTEPALATFREVGRDETVATVRFNPASLKVSLTNKLQDEEEGGNGQARQATRVSTTKLETELVFDSTEDGSDVRDLSGGVKALAIAPEGDHPRPPQVEFRWGRFSFTGCIESLNETLDFWSAEGVPLRSTLQVTMQGLRLDSTAEGAPDAATLAPVAAGGTGATGAATQAGAPNAGRAVAAANGMEDMRMAAGGSVSVSASVTLRAAASFSAGASVGAGAGAGFGIGASASAGAGIGASAGAGFGIGASTGAGIGISAGASFGAGASAGASASAGAFAGLGASKTFASPVRLDASRLLPPAPPLVGSGASFDVTGKVVGPSSAGLSARLDAGVAPRVRFG
jgi:hypothetical protein